MCSNKCHWADHWKGLKVAISTINSTYRHLSLSSVRCWVRRVKSERDPRTFWTVVGTLIAWKIYTQWYHASQKLRLSAPSKKKKKKLRIKCLPFMSLWQRYVENLFRAHEDNGIRDGWGRGTTAPNPPDYFFFFGYTFSEKLAWKLWTNCSHCSLK